MKARKIPATMVTQHPDHGARPYWHDQEYVSTQEETEEAYRSFSELGASEYKWDWEGKLVDESVLERLFGEHFNYFTKNPLGMEKFLTFRLPNPKVETEFRLSRAFMNIISASSISKHLGLHSPSLFEVILPMTESAEEIIAIQEAFDEINHLKHPLFKQDNSIEILEVIPLFEQVSTMIRSDKILQKYITYYKKRFKKKPVYLRPYVARSDPALNSGLIPTVLAVKIALSHYKNLSQKLGIELFPIIGAGSLPFRGGANPDNVDNFLREYEGIKTTTVQSAFRYDYPLPKVIEGIAKLEKKISKSKSRSISASEEKALSGIILESERYYKSVVEKIAGTVNSVAGVIPRRRERYLHVGLFGYSRGDSKVKLPRAISFTAVLYSLGIPPELIGTGRAVKYAIKSGKIETLERFYVNLRQDLLQAGKYLNKDNLSRLSKKSPAWKEIEENVKLLEDFLETDLEPISEDEKMHGKISEKVLSRIDDAQGLRELIGQAAILRKSLG
jgi:phosphoenolpyruvate carboxylase